VRLEYEYDNARRLTAVENSLGERIEYTLDDMGNRTGESIKNSGGGIVKSMTRTHDELGRLLSSIGAGSQTTAYAYDKNDNVTSITDPLSGVTAQAYDALDRLISSTDPATEVTAYGYDDRDHLTAVTDARGVQTAYVVDGFGRVIQTASPDGGTTVYVYDKADNLTEKTDGRGVVTQYSYDALNRITSKTFPAASAENVGYSYDDATSGHFGIGRLDTITDESGSTAFIYDSRGNVVQETRTIAGTAYVTQYVYDVADRLTQMVYPSGRIVSYARDTLGRVTAVTTQASASAAPATIASNIAYRPFGPIASMLYDNGLTRSYSYDSDYLLADLVTGDADTFVQDLAYGYDDADNILSISDAIASGRSQTFTYDDLFRLKTAAASGTYGSITYNYDEVGNRTSVVDGAGTESYSTDSASNRLLSATLGSTTRTFTYDGAGNITVDARGGTTYGLTYNKANRLAGVSVNSTADTDYLYNALGERVKKAPAATPTAGTRFHYDRDGKLIAESDGSGAVIREYAWLEGLPIGEFTNDSPGTPPGQTQLDNTDSGASFTGSWSAATAGSGYIGSTTISTSRSPAACRWAAPPSTTRAPTSPPSACGRAPPRPRASRAATMSPAPRAMPTAARPSRTTATPDSASPAPGSRPTACPAITAPTMSATTPTSPRPRPSSSTTAPPGRASSAPGRPPPTTPNTAPTSASRPPAQEPPRIPGRPRCRPAAERRQLEPAGHRGGLRAPHAQRAAGLGDHSVPQRVAHGDVRGAGAVIWTGCGSSWTSSEGRRREEGRS
jgi:YD repeat-containing protein